MSSIKQLILASQSPFRRALLEATGVAFVAETAPLDERTVTGRTPRELAERRSVAKAMALALLRPESLVIGADQVLSLDGLSFDKAEDPGEARARLAALSGRTHYLHSGMALVYAPANGTPEVLCAEVIDAAMRMRPLTTEEIDAYVATGEWRGSVGCYQYENRGAHLFADGGEPGPEQATIVGLPIGRLLERLRALGVNGLTAPRPPWVLLRH